MNMSARLKLTKDDFYRFVERQAEGRFEFEDGHIVQQMAGGTLAHTILGERFRDCLRRQLDPADWLVTSEKRGVDTAKTVRYPDVIVEPAGGDLASLSTDCPGLVIEILSDSTSALDLNTKPSEYMGLASIQAYIVASQDEPECLVWRRLESKRFSPKPELVKGRKRKIRIASLAVTIPLAEIYAGIGRKK